MKKFVIIILFFTAGLMSAMCQTRDLAYYIGQAGKNSPLINKALNDSKIADLDQQQMNRILTNPEVNLVSGVTLSPIISHDNNSNRFQLASAGAVDYTGHDLALTDGGQYQAMVSVRQPLLGASKLKAYENKSNILQSISNNTVSLTLHEIEQVVGYQYVLCLKAKHQAENSLALRNQMDDQVNVMKRLVENAVYKQTDLIILQIEAQNYESDYRSNLNDYRTNLYDLNQLCGINDTAITDLSEISLSLSPGKTGASEFLTSYKLDSLNIVADQAINELRYKPQLDLFADAGLNAAYLPYPKRTGLSAGFTFSWNIFDGHQKEIQRKKSALDIQSVEFEKQNFMTVNAMNRKKILNQIESLDQRIAIGEKQISRYGDLYGMFSKELAAGEVSVMDFKNMVRDMAVKKQEVLQLQLEKQLLINSYNYLNY